MGEEGCRSKGLDSFAETRINHIWDGIKRISVDLFIGPNEVALSFMGLGAHLKPPIVC